MILTEYDCSRSTAIKRIAINKFKHEIIVIWSNSDDIYLYHSIPVSTFKLIILAIENKNVSYGRLVNVIKPLSQCRKVPSFARNTELYQVPSTDESESREQIGEYQSRRRRRGHPVNRGNGESAAPSRGHRQRMNSSSRAVRYYIKEWSDLLSTKDYNVLSADYTNICVDLLKSLQQDLPPTLPPPNHASQQYSNENNHSDENVEEFHDYQQTNHRLNSYAVLSADDEDIDEALAAEFNRAMTLENNNRSNSSNHNSNGDGNNGSYSSIFMQTRYIIIRLIAHLAEVYRHEAIQAQKLRQYAQVASYWVLAYDTLNKCLVENEAETEELFSNNYYNGTDTDNSDLNRQCHRELLNVLNILSDDTKRGRDKAVHLLETELIKIERKLSPLLQDRDAVKTRMGEDRWTNNPEPKQTYAERRKQMEEDAKLLKIAILTLNQLTLYNEFNNNDTADV